MVKWLLDTDGDRIAKIIPAAQIVRSAHLFPKFGASAIREWTSDTVLDDCSTFYVNLWSDPHAYLTIY
jgi:hypothetical protein